MADRSLTDWFTSARFGMFIHWGIYAAAARHEWVKQYEQIPDDEYQKYFDHFDPDLYDPDQWAQLAQGAGMKYFVITTKHHDGFCLWDSKLTDYKVTNTPHGKDLLRPMVNAFRARGLHVGFYHSLIDWHHPQFVIDDVHSQRNHPDRDKLNATRDQNKYVDYLHGQVRELLTDFGDIDVLFMDFSYPAGKYGRPADFHGKGKDDWQSEKLYQLIRELQPNVLLNDRMDLGYGSNIVTPEQHVPREPVRVGGKRVVWEACHTFSGSWGYHRDESSWKSVDQLIRMLVDIVSKDGNLLLNVGPTARGTFDARAIDRLRGMGEWMHLHARSIDDCTAAPADFPPPPDCRYTFNPKTNRLYLHLFAWPFKHVFLDGLGDRIAYAQLLHDASQVKVGPDQWILNQAHGDAPKSSNTAVLELPVRQPDSVVPVVEIFLK
jgi:alpha-L-fucosidase